MNFRWRSAFGALTVAAAMAAIWSCQPRTVIRNGVEMPYDQAAGLDFRLAQERYAKGKKAEAIAQLKDFVQKYPNSTWTDDAFSMLGDIALADGKNAEAATYYQILIQRYSFSSLKGRAQMRLGVAQYRDQKYEAAIAAWQPLLSQLTDPVDRLEVNTLVASAYEQLKQPLKAVPNYANMVAIYQSNKLGSDLQTSLTKIPSAEVARQRSIDEINKSIDETFLKEIARAYGDRFPAQHALHRLADLELSGQNPTQAENTLQDLLRKFPADTLAEDAKSVLRRLQGRYLTNQNKIGVILPLTGQFASAGQEALHGIEMAVALMADSYPRSELEFFIMDSKGDPKVCADAVNTLVTEHQVVAIIGPLFGADSLAAAKQAQSLNVPLISLSPAEGIPAVGNYIFRNALLYRNEVKTLVEYAMAARPADPAKAGRFAILYPVFPNSNYGISYRDLFWDEITAHGGVVVGAEVYKSKQKDFSEPVKKLVGLYYPEPRQTEWNEMRKQAKEKKGKRMRDVILPPVTDFQALFIPVTSYTTGALIADYLPYFGVKDVTLLGNYNWNNPGILERSRRNVQGAVFTDGFYPGSQKPNVIAFVANYRGAFGVDPSVLPATAFDTAEILITLLQEPQNQSRDKLRSALSALKNYDGVTGSTSFNEEREVQKRPFLLTVEGDRIVEVAARLAPAH